MKVVCLGDSLTYGQYYDGPPWPALLTGYEVVNRGVNSDTTRLPAALHSDYLDLYLENPLPRPGALRLLETPIDLGKVACDTFILAGMTDHITPWQACYASTRMLGGNKEFVLSSSGHIQSVINPPGNPKAKFFRNPRLAADPAAWLAAAEPQPGRRDVAT